MEYELPDDLKHEVMSWYMPQLRKRMMHRTLLKVMRSYKEKADEDKYIPMHCQFDWLARPHRRDPPRKERFFS